MSGEVITPVRTVMEHGRIIDVTGCPRIYLSRSQKVNADESQSGWLTIYPNVYAAGSLHLPTIERGDGYVSLKIGQYIMKHSTKTRGKGRIHCLRPVETGIQRILIHDAYNDSAQYLSGCIAPGLVSTQSGGISGSADAMKKMFNFIGGWKEGSLVKLDVLSNVPGDNRTRDTWKRTR